MSRRITYVHATPEHGAAVAAAMRRADRDEVWAAVGLHPMEAVAFSMRATRSPVCGLYEGRPVGVFGVVPVSTLDGVGAPWMLGTDEAAMLAREWLIEAPQWLALLGDGYSVLRNWVDARNRTSVRWLRRMGFSVAPAEPWGVRGLAFHRFERRV